VPARVHAFLDFLAAKLQAATTTSPPPAPPPPPARAKRATHRARGVAH